MTIEMMHLKRVALGAALLVLCLAGIAGSAVAQQPGRAFPYRWSGTVPADEITVADVQHALIWTGHYGAMVDGAYGPGSKSAVRSWLIAKGYPPADSLTNDQAVELLMQGLKVRDNVGWAVLSDPSVGFKVGMPTKLTELQSPIWKDGGLQYSAFGPVGNFVTVFPDFTCKNLDALYEILTMPLPGQRDVHYKARKDDWFVVSGDAGERHFYRRTQCRSRGTVTAIMNMPLDLTGTFGFMLTAMSNSFFVSQSLNPAARPAPRFEYPPPSPWEASHVGRTPAPAPVPAPLGVDRTGRTGAVKLVLSDGKELRPSEVFAKASEAVYVVKSANVQGSAVAISDRELLTNCHVVGDRSGVSLERQGAEVRASVTSADRDADRCVLTSDAALPRWVKVRPFSDVKVGERVFTIGAPQGLELTLAEGIVSSKRSVGGSRLVQTSAPISQGSSGGGLFDAEANLIGITTFMLKDAQNLNFAIAAEEYAK